MINLRKKDLKYYYLTEYGKYKILRKGTYYGTCDSEDQAQEVVELLKENDWDPSVIPSSMLTCRHNTNYQTRLKYAALLQQGLITQEEFNQIIGGDS